VPALYENMALHEITAFERERPGLRQEVPARGISPLIPACFLLLAFWHGLRFHWFPFDLPAPLFPAPAGDWAERFGLDIYRVWFSGQWWRCATALTLHADGVHLAGNIVFGLLFLPALCRRAGTGLGLALALLAGILGNAADVALRDAPRISLGFSTALFGSLGSLCGLMGADALRLASAGERLSLFGPKGGLLLPPLAAGLALLGFLGGGAEARTDYAAHVGGFCAGLILAAALLPLDALLRRLAPGREKAVQALLAVLALALFPLAWCLAL
jgi:membrane associated rhomboid family serine protease